ncbi:MAG TPA: hypothetical protein VKP65_22390 [Rhodothermales bacterium]|nr:hypothetical protein [Rhodothermales bacterium]
MSEPTNVPRGLVFFPPNTSPSRRRKRLVFMAVLLTTAMALVWPVYALFSGISPLVLGLPLSMAWPVFWQAVMFATLVWLYRSEA